MVPELIPLLGSQPADDEFGVGVAESNGSLPPGL